MDRSPLLDLPFACLDELDKADPPLMAAALALLQGDAEAELEDTPVGVRPVTYVCLNAGSAGLRVIPNAYMRRSVVLDTAAVAPLLADMDEAAARLLAPGTLPRLDLDQLSPLAAELPPDWRGWLRQGLRERLTPDGWRVADVESVARLALGRAAFPAAGGMAAAVVATAADYLATAATLGHTADGWAFGLAEWLGQAREHGAVMVPDMARHHAETRQLAAARQDRAVGAQRESADVAAARAELAARLREHAAFLDARRLRPAALASLRAEAAGIRAALTGLAAKAADTRSRDSLSAVAAASDEWTARADGLRARIDEMRQQHDQAESAERTNRERQRRAAAEQARNSRAAAAAARRTDAARTAGIKKARQAESPRRGDRGPAARTPVHTAAHWQLRPAVHAAARAARRGRPPPAGLPAVRCPVAVAARARHLGSPRHRPQLPRLTGRLPAAQRMGTGHAGRACRRAVAAAPRGGSAARRARPATPDPAGPAQVINLELT